MIVVTEDEEGKVLHFPANYSLENILISVLVKRFIQEKLLSVKSDNVEVSKLKSELSSLLITHFKYSFTKVEVSIEGSIIRGHIEYIGGKPIRFELETKS